MLSLEIAKLFENLGIIYLPRLHFANRRTEKWVEKRCKKALKYQEITSEQKWLGVYYEKELSASDFPPIEIRWIDNRIGWGVFAKRNFAFRDFIGEYTGLLRRKNRRKDEKNSYCFEYFIGDSIETPFTIDASDQGNFTRFINHHPQGNLDPMLIFSHGIMRVILYANQPIQKGEEMTYNYGSDYWAKRERPIYNQTTRK